MWGTLAAAQGMQLEQQPNSAALAALWTGEQGWPGTASAALQQAHLAPLAQRGLEGGQGSVAWPSSPAQPESHAGQHHTAAAKIYVQGLPQSLQHPVAVAGLFSPFGDVLDVKLYAAEVRLSGGSAVVRMRSTTQAAAAIAALNGVVPEGGWQQLTVRAAETAEQRSSRITAINGRQQGGPMGGLPPQLGMPAGSALPPAGPGAATSAALRRVHSARGAGSHGSLHCYTGALVGEGGPPPPRHSADWAAPGCRDGSMDSRRSSLDAMRCASAAFGHSSSESGSGGDGGEEAGGGGDGGAEAQRLLLEAVLALVGQVEGGQLSLAAMRTALESALAAAKGSAAPGEQPPLLHAQPAASGRAPASPPA